MEGDVTATASACSSAFSFRQQCVTCGTFGSWSPRMWECDVCQDYFLCENCYKRSLEDCEVVSTLAQGHTQAHRMSSHVTTFYCNGCGSSPIWNQRWHCKVCIDFDLCEACFRELDVADIPPEHSKEHPMLGVEVFGLENLLKFQSSFSEPVVAKEDAMFTACTNHKDLEDVLEGCSSSIAASPNFHTPKPFNSFSIQSGVEAATTIASDISSSPCFSARIQRLSDLRNAFDNQLEFEIESSKSHWTQSSNSEDGCEQMSNIDSFERLKEHPEWGPFLRREPYTLEIGRKIAEGGQAEIFEALGTSRFDDDRLLVNNDRKLYMSDNPDKKREVVVKVFHKGFPLQDLQRSWPSGLAAVALPYRYFLPSHSTGEGSGNGLCWAIGAQLLMDDRFAGRFAFVFDRLWGDLRKVIDARMDIRNGSHPFSLLETCSILLHIAEGMASLHKLNLLHKDLKAANVLMTSGSDNWEREYSAYIADFESSVGIVGTGFWRAPEVLLAVQNHCLKSETFTQQADVYSYAMTCYEVITGRLPFEDHPVNDYDIVLVRGARPPLPNDVPPQLENVVRKCWHQDPLQRPSFLEIAEHLRELISKADEQRQNYSSEGIWGEDYQDCLGTSQNHESVL